MLTCKQVSKTLTNQDYEKLSPMRKFFLLLHVKLCFFCGKSNRQVMDTQDMCRCFKKHEHTLEATRDKLDDAHKEALKGLLAEQSRSTVEEPPAAH
jgi:thioredoxin-related protein